MRSALFALVLALVPGQALAQVCYLRCSGPQRITNGSLAVAFVDAGTINIGQATNALTFSGGNVLDINSGGYTGFVFNNTVTNKATGTGFQSHAANGTDAFKVDTNGAHWHIGTGASDYWSSDGTTMTAAGPVTAASTLTVASTLTTQGLLTTQNDIRPWAGGDNSEDIGSSTLRYRSVSAFALFNYNGIGTAASGTGITATYSGALRQFVHKVVVTNAAMAAAATTDITLHVTPVNTSIRRVLAEVTQVFDDGAGPLTAVAVTCGKTAGGNEYLLSHSELTATGTFGDVVAEMGAGVVSATLADMGTVAAGVPGAITVQCRFTCTGANCSVASTGSTTFIVEGTTY